MTKNFDPERWLAIASEALQATYREGRLNRGAYETPRDCLQENGDGRWDRLDGSCRLPDDKTR